MRVYHDQCQEALQMISQHCQAYGFVPSDNKPLPEQMLIKICDGVRRRQATMSSVDIVEQ